MRKLNTTDINYLKKLFEKYDAERRNNGLLNWKIWTVFRSWGWGKSTEASGLRCFHMPLTLPRDWRRGNDVVTFMGVGFILLPLSGMMDDCSLYQIFFQSQLSSAFGFVSKYKGAMWYNALCSGGTVKFSSKCFHMFIFPKTLVPKFFISKPLTTLTWWEAELQWRVETIWFAQDCMQGEQF